MGFIKSHTEIMILNAFYGYNLKEIKNAAKQKHQNQICINTFNKLLHNENKFFSFRFENTCFGYNIEYVDVFFKQFLTTNALTKVNKNAVMADLKMGFKTLANFLCKQFVGLVDVFQLIVFEWYFLFVYVKGLKIKKYEDLNIKYNSITNLVEAIDVFSLNIYNTKQMYTVVLSYIDCFRSLKLKNVLVEFMVTIKIDFITRIPAGFTHNIIMNLIDSFDIKDKNVLKTNILAYDKSNQVTINEMTTQYFESTKHFEKYTLYYRFYVNELMQHEEFIICF